MNFVLQSEKAMIVLRKHIETAAADHESCSRGKGATPIPAPPVRMPAQSASTGSSLWRSFESVGVFEFRFGAVRHSNCSTAYYEWNRGLVFAL